MAVLDLTKLAQQIDLLQDRLIEVLTDPAPSYTEKGRTFKTNEYIETLEGALTRLVKLYNQNNTDKSSVVKIRYIGKTDPDVTILGDPLFLLNE
jgi:hypothetical protein